MNQLPIFKQLAVFIDKARQNFYANMFTANLRILIAVGFVFASIRKIQGLRFVQLPESDPIGGFFEALYQTGSYWEFLGWSQLVAALLLMLPRFSTLGAVVFFPIMLNIVVITNTMGFEGTWLVADLMLLANIYLLLWDYQRLQHILFNKPVFPVSNSIDILNHHLYFRIWTLVGVLAFSSIVVCGRWPQFALICLLLCTGTIVLGLVVSYVTYRKKEFGHPIKLSVDEGN